MDPKRWKQVDNLLQSMLGLPPEERDAFLCHACRDDKELESEVRSLLTSHQQAGRFLDGLAIEEAARALVDNHRDQTCEDSELRQQVAMLDSNHDTARLVARGSLVGREFGSYRILSLLGAGGMGEVYRAYDSKLGRDVAIKTLPYQFAGDPERLARFRREARTLASLNHPNIAAIMALRNGGKSISWCSNWWKGRRCTDHSPLAPRSIAPASWRKHSRRRTSTESFIAI
jgi:eukaryotic-like serine/threonine-protein kinase